MSEIAAVASRSARTASASGGRYAERAYSSRSAASSCRLFLAASLRSLAVAVHVQPFLNAHDIVHRKVSIAAEVYANRHVGRVSVDPQGPHPARRRCASPLANSNGERDERNGGVV